MRLEVLYYYTNGLMKCECGKTDIEFLEVHHKNGGGRKHIASINCSIYEDIIKHNFEEDYQILCSNCNIKIEKEKSKLIGLFGSKQQQYEYRYREKLKLKVFSHYMTDNKIKCSCPGCNENDIDVLTIDHTNGDGKEHRETLSKGGIGGSIVYRDIKKRNYPQDEFRILCYNCNKSISSYGYCPHDIISFITPLTNSIKQLAVS